MCVFFLRYVLKAQGNRPRDPSGLMCMCVDYSWDMYEFFMRYVSKAEGNSPRDPWGLMCMCVLFIRYVLKA